MACVRNVDGLVTMPQRIQLRRTKGWRMPANTVKVDRTTIYGNPFRIGDDPSKHKLWWRVSEDARNRFTADRWPWVIHTAEEAVDLFRGLANSDHNRETLAAIARHDLEGRNLACWCPIDQPCHADVLLELANAPAAPAPAR